MQREIGVSSLATGCDRPGGKHKQLCQASGEGNDEEVMRWLKGEAGGGRRKLQK